VDIQFTKPIAASSVTAANFFLLRNDTGSPIPATLSQPQPNVVRITPTAALDPTNGPYYRIHIQAAVQDTNGNSYAGPTASYYFYLYSTAVPDTNVPTLVAAGPLNGSTVGDNALINLVFSKGMDTTSINAATITVNGGVVPASFSFSGSNTIVTVTPLAPLPDNANLTLSLSNGIIDPSGNALTPQTINFSTGNGPDVTAPFVVSSTVDNGITVPSNAVYSVQFNKPMYTPSLQNTIYLYDYTAGGYVTTNHSFSADGMTATINPVSPLTAGHSIGLVSNNGQDLDGNTQVSYSAQFTASATPDLAPPTVIATTPGAGQTSSVPINSLLQVLFNKSVQFGSLSQIALTGGPAITLTPSLTNGDQTVILTPNAPLTPNTTYTLTVQGVTSTAGVTMSAPLSVTFTTGPAVVLLGPLTSSVVPANGAVGVAATVTPTVTFSTPIDPLTAYGNIVLRLSNNTVVGSSLSFSADYKTVTITPNSSLTSGTTYNVYVAGASITDQAGNALRTPATAYSFTTQ
jgi:hypothetical protein